MPPLSETPLVNAAIARARSLPELIASLPPGMAAQLETKPLLASRSPWGTLAIAAVTWLASREALGWDDTTCALVAGAGVVLGSYAMRAVTRQPIAGIASTPPGTPPDIAMPETGAATGADPAGPQNSVTSFDPDHHL